VKQNITGVVSTLALALAVLGSAIARAQSPPQPASPQVAVPPSAADNSVAPPTLPPGTEPSSPLGHVIQMLQSGTAERAILAYVSDSTGPFNIGAADLVYLNDLGTPSEIETAMTRRDRALGVNPAAQPRPTPGQNQQPQDITEDYFFGALAQYGSWVDIPNYGLCWQPCAATYNSGWAPYFTMGQWLYTDCGWYWLSDYSWGWCVFHYGRWFHDTRRGWCWWPATKWAPSWVFWRYSGSYCGWAPLPPHSYYSQGNGLVYNGASVPSDYDFGIGANLFNFVPMANLFDDNIEHYRLSAVESAQIFEGSKVLSAINSNDRTIVNDGIPVHKIAAAAHGAMRSFTIQPVESVAVPGARGEQISPDGETLAVNRPHFNTDVPSALRQGIFPVPSQQQPVPHQPPSIIVNENPLIQPVANNENNNVIYVDRAAQNGPPVPTVTMAGPLDYAGSAPGPVASGGSYWSVSAEAPAPVYSASAYMSPRLQSHERWQRHVEQPPNHRDFNPSSPEPHSAEQHQSHQDHAADHLASPHPAPDHSPPPEHGR